MFLKELKIKASDGRGNTNEESPFSQSFEKRNIVRQMRIDHFTSGIKSDEKHAQYFGDTVAIKNISVAIEIAGLLPVPPFIPAGSVFVQVVCKIFVSGDSVFLINTDRQFFQNAAVLILE